MTGTLRDRFYCGVSFIFFLLLASSGQAQTTLTLDSLQNGKSFELDKLDWKYSPGDDLQFADPQFDDRAWETLHGTAITLDSIPKSGWHGIGWFRLRLQVDQALTNQPLALVMVHFGASEIYLDGKLVQRFGTVAATPETEVEYNPNTLPFSIALDGRNEHVIAVRHSCTAMQNLSGGWGRWLARQSDRPGLNAATNRTVNYGAGFGISLAESKQVVTSSLTLRSKLIDMRFGIGLFFAIGVLHLLLFKFYPRQRAALFFGLFACLGAITGACSVLLRTSHQGTAGAIFLWWTNVLALVSAFACLLAFQYAAFSLRVPSRFWYWLMGIALTIFLGIFLSSVILLRLLGALILLFPIIEVARGLIEAVRKQVSGAWIVGGGMLVFTAGFSLSVDPRFGEFTGLLAATTLIFSISIFLARQFARTNLDLEDQLVQVKQLSAAALEHEKVKAENDRRAAELEEARQLQLSMLPKKLPNLPHLDIAAYMKTASEVGGDYYDFHTSEDGTLTIAIGDATGHGLKAGTLVSAVKSLFISLAYHPDIPHIFMRMSQTLKQMQMRGVFMAMAMIKYKDRSVNISIAGMPPMMLYRHALQTVERINLTGLPLGSVTSYRYREMTTELQPGDALLMLSDGLTELFNPANEMFGEERVEPSFQAAAESSPTEIIARLLADAEQWSNGRALDDDLTLVVLKAK